MHIAEILWSKDNALKVADSHIAALKDMVELAVSMIPLPLLRLPLA